MQLRFLFHQTLDILTFLLTFYTSTLLYIFSILFSIHFFQQKQGEFVIISFTLMTSNV